MATFKDIGAFWLSEKLGADGKPKLTGKFDREAAATLALEIETGRLSDLGLMVQRNKNKTGRQPDYRLVLILPDEEPKETEPITDEDIPF